ncbi:MAG: DUF1848 family protein, partial [Planctomycetota bacterium]
MCWRVDNLDPEAVGVSVSRRTDIPALFSEWFGRRLEQGFAEYIPPGPPRRMRRSLRPEDVTHFNFWTKWPRPFFRVLERVLEAEYPVLWNVTVTGLGSTQVEPHVPASGKVVASIVELSHMVPPSAILWRYDPILVSAHYDRRYHRETFGRLVEALAGHVDRVAVSFVTRYKRQVEPDLQAYQRASGDTPQTLPLPEQIELAVELREVAAAAGIPLTLCCSPDVRQAASCPRSGCNSFDWVRRVYPALEQHRRLKDRPCRPDCGCSAEVDIGVYDTCVLGCRYSYGSRDLS